MASQSGEYSELNFTGESAEEAQDFVQAVHRRAYAAGRQKDNTWMAEFAFPCFSRKALVWYATLDEETRNDWQLLMRAVLGEFTASPSALATVPSAAPALVSSPSNPTPAAAPPSAVTLKIGRIRVHSGDLTKRGYFYINSNNYGAIVADSSKATIFEVDTLAQTLRFKGSGESLVIAAERQNWPFSPRTERYGLMWKSTEVEGTQWNHRWSITDGGNMTATLLRPDGGQWDATFVVHQSFLGAGIHVPADKEGFLAKYESYNCVVVSRIWPGQQFKVVNLTRFALEDPAPGAAIMRSGLSRALTTSAL